MMDLKGDQAQAVAFLNSWIVMRNAPVANLQGYAGTGKTWLVSQWAGDLMEANKDSRITILAPTNKALDVLRTKCLHLPQGRLTFATVDSFLGRRISKDEDNETVTSIGRGLEAPTLVICDEASMIKSDYDRDLRGRCRTSKLLYVGDPAQLPPIEDGLPEGAVSNAFNCDHKFIMTEVVRYEGSIIKVATHLRECITEKKTWILPDLLAHKEDNTVTRTSIDMMYDWALKARDKGLDTRIVAFENAVVNRHNAHMHGVLFPDAELFGEGERVVVNEAFELENDDMLLNGEMATVLSCEFDRTHASVDIYKVRIRRDRQAYVEVDGEVINTTELELEVARDADHAARTFKAITNEIWTLRREGGSQERIRELNELRRPLRKLAPLRHSYACTVHKSQGSTYDVTFVDWVSVYKSRDRSRMMYVAATRPSKFLVFCMK